MTYPYTPKSNIKIEIGDYFPIEIADDQYAYCVILSKSNTNRVMIQIGVLDIVGNTPLINSNKVKSIYQTHIHYKAINKLNTQIVGCIQIPEITLELNCNGGSHCYVVKGYDNVRLATKEDKGSMPISSVAGHLFLRNKIEKLFRS